MNGAAQGIAPWRLAQGAAVARRGAEGRHARLRLQVQDQVLPVAGAQEEVPRPPEFTKPVEDGEFAMR